MIGRVLALCLAASPAASRDVDSVTADVFRHKLLHELGHALIREFDLPVLGPEEMMADAFATAWLAAHDPDDAPRVIAATARLWMHRSDEEAELMSEHPPFARRAWWTVCLAFHTDPDAYEEVAAEIGLSDDALDDCRDLGPEVARGWRRTLGPLAMPPGPPVTEVGLRYEDGADIGAARDAVEQAAAVARGFDFHSRVTFSVERCDDEIGWSRNGRTIRLCDAYVARIRDAVAEMAR